MWKVIANPEEPLVLVKPSYKLISVVPSPTFLAEPDPLHQRKEAVVMPFWLECSPGMWES